MSFRIDSRFAAALERRIDNVVLALDLTPDQHVALLRGILPELHADREPLRPNHRPAGGERDGALPRAPGGYGSLHFGQAVTERHNGLEVNGVLVPRPGRRFSRPADAAEPQAARRGRNAADAG